MSTESGSTGQAATYSDIDYWQTRWDQNEIQFHKQDNHPALVKFIDRLTENKSNQLIFFPLCGKAVDIAWLASLGHQVVGVEVVEAACEQFFQDQNIKYSTNQAGDFKLYKSEDGKIRIYNGDFFKFTKEIEGPLENIWDRGSLVALPGDLRKKYASHIQTLLATQFKYLISTYEYDQALYPGPPHSVTADEIKTHYEAKCKIELLESVHRPAFNGIECNECVYLLTPINN